MSLRALLFGNAPRKPSIFSQVMVASTAWNLLFLVCPGAEVWRVAMCSAFVAAAYRMIYIEALNPAPKE